MEAVLTYGKAMQPATLVASIARTREIERHERHAVGAAERTGDNGKGDRDVRNGVGRDLLADDLHTATISCDDVGQRPEYKHG